MLRVSQEERISIEEVINSSFFDQVRDLVSAPELDESHTKLREICLDFVKRRNVYKFKGQTDFDQTY
jgi:hypothetical protein